MNEKILQLQTDQKRLIDNIISQIDNLDSLNLIERAYSEGYIEGGLIRNKMIGNMLQKMLVKHKDHLDFQLELKEFIEELKNE